MAGKSFILLWSMLNSNLVRNMFPRRFLSFNQHYFNQTLVLLFLQDAKET